MAAVRGVFSVWRLQSLRGIVSSSEALIFGSDCGTLWTSMGLMIRNRCDTRASANVCQHPFLVGSLSSANSMSSKRFRSTSPCPLILVNRCLVSLSRLCILHGKSASSGIYLRTHKLIRFDECYPRTSVIRYELKDLAPSSHTKNNMIATTLRKISLGDSIYVLFTQQYQFLVRQQNNSRLPVTANRFRMNVNS